MDAVEHQSDYSSSVLDDSPTMDVGWKLRQALKQQLVLIHERVQAKKIAKLALAEVRRLLVKEEEEEKELGMKRKEVLAKAKERVAAGLMKEEELIEKEKMRKVVETDVKEKPHPDEEKKALPRKGVGIESKDKTTVVKKPRGDEERASPKEKGKKN